MNGNRILAVDGNAAAQKQQTGMDTTLSEYQRSKPDSLLPGDRKFPDQERANLWSPCSNCSSSDENNSPTALNSFNWDKPALGDKSVDFGWGPAQENSGRSSVAKTSERRHKQSQEDKKPSGYVNMRSKDSKCSTDCRIPMPEQSPKGERQSNEGHQNVTDLTVADNSHHPCDRLHHHQDIADSDDPENVCQDSNSSLDGRSDEDILKEKEDLRNVAWFQAGIPREIALEVLAEKPEGSFIVRESTTKPGCYALSLRVPPGRNPAGIAHYLILQTNKGYKIKGFTKEFTSLSALITHHSVMPELLPCPLSLSRQTTRDAEQEFAETEHKGCDIFSDIHWLMTDLEL